MARRDEELHVELLSLRLRSGAAEVQEVGSTVRIAVRREPGNEQRGERRRVVRIARGSEEVRGTVEDTRAEDELVDPVVRRVGLGCRPRLPDVRDEGGADRVDAPRVEDADQAAERIGALLGRDEKPEIVRARVEQDVGDAADAEDVPLEPLGEYLCQRAELTASWRGRGIAADSLVHDRHVLPEGRM